MANIDTDNLSYVSKAYENEIKNTAKRLYANDIVNTTMEETNEKLDKLIKQLNQEYNFANEKIYGKDGLDEYIADSHSEIDNISIDTNDFISDEIKNTKSHPSINAFKESRDFTAYKSYDFINKSIALNKDTVAFDIDGNGPESTDKVHTFRLNLNTDESLKILEFNINYRQNPNLVSIVDGEAYKEPSVQVSRVIKGKFFIIRPDLEKPEELIVKAIVENSDNTGNVIDENIIDASSSKKLDNVITKNGIGPEFDLYFKYVDTSHIDICIGRIVPYKWMIRKNYITVDNDNTEPVELINSNISGVHIDKVLYSKSANKYIVIDNTDKMIYYTDDSKLEPSKFTKIENFEHTNNIKIFNIDSVTFLSNGITTIVFGNDITNFTNLTYVVADVQKVSTGEIIINVNNTKLCVFDTTTFNATDLDIFKVSSVASGFAKKTKFFEIETGRILMLSVTESRMYYQSITVNNETGMYVNPNTSVSEYIEITKAVGWDAESVNFDLIHCVDNSFIVAFNYTKTNDKLSIVMNFGDITINGTTIVFDKQKEIKYFDLDTHETSNFNKYIKKLYHTSLLDFAITDENKLLVIDTDYIYDAIHFTEEFEEVSTYDEATNSNITQKKSLGYSLNKSILFMNPEIYESKYFNSNSVFMQNVYDVFESESGIYICDKYGLYELSHNKNLKTVFYSESGNVASSINNINNEFGLIICKSIDDIHSVFKHSYNIVNVTDKRLRYKYTDLYNEKWQVYKTVNDTYESNTKIIEISGIMYVSVVDRMSSMYNTSDSTNMVYSTELNTFENVNPYSNANVTKFVLSINKYGIVNYHGFENLDIADNVSDINSIKSYVLVHKPGDGLTIDDYRNIIQSRILKEAEGDKVLVEQKKVYVPSNDDINLDANRIIKTNYTPVQNIIDCFGYPLVINNDSLYILDYPKITYDQASLGAIIDAKCTSNHLYILTYKGVYCFTRAEAIKALKNGTAFINAEHLVINTEKYASDNEYYARNGNWLSEYISDTENDVFICNKGYKLRNYNDGSYTLPFKDETRAFDVLTTDNEFNRIKTLNGETYFWNSSNENYTGLFVYDSTSSNKCRSVLSKTYFENFKVNDIVINKSNKNQFLMSIDTDYTLTNRKPTCDLIIVDINGNITQINPATSNVGCKYNFVEYKEYYAIGTYGKIILVNQNDFTQVKTINIPSIIKNAYYNCYSVNGELVIFDVSSNKSNGYYVLQNDQYVKYFCDSQTQSFGFYKIVSIEDNFYVLAKDTRDILCKYVSPNEIKEISTQSLDQTVSFMATLPNNANIALKYNDDHIIRNGHMGTTDYIDKFFRNQAVYTKIDTNNNLHQNLPGEWVLVGDDKEYRLSDDYCVIDGDATKWSPFKVEAGYKFTDNIRVYKFVASSNSNEYEKINTTKVKKPIPGFNYWTASKVDENTKTPVTGITEFDSNKNYYRKSGKWVCVTGETATSDTNYYYSEDVIYVKAKYSSHYDTNLEDSNHSCEWDLTAIRQSIDPNITYDTYEFYRVDNTNTLYRQSFANTNVSDPLNTKRFNNPCIISGDNKILLPVIIRNNITSKLTGTEDPYSNTDPFTNTQAMNLASTVLFKSVILDGELVETDIDNYTRSDMTKLSPYSVFPIYKEFATSAGKFVLYQQHYDKTSDIKLNLGLISDDYKQIYSVLIENISDVNSIHVFEDKENNIYISNITARTFKRYSKSTMSINNDDTINAAVSNAFTDNDGNFILIEYNESRIIVYKYDIENKTSQIVWELNEEDSVRFVPITEGNFITRYTDEDLLEVYLLGNGDYNVYKYNKLNFVPLFMNISNTDTKITRAKLDSNNEINVLVNYHDNDGYTFKITKDDKLETFNTLHNWNYLTDKNDLTYSYKYLIKNTNYVFDIANKLATQPTLNKGAGRILPGVTIPPIEINGEVYFNNCKANINTLLEDHSTDYVAYDYDGVSVVSGHIYFEYMNYNSYGLFGVCDGYIYRNNLDSNGNGFIRVGSGVKNSNYINIIETKYGLMYVDNRNVLKFNEETNTFESVSQTISIDTGIINFIIQANEGVFIASKSDRITANTEKIPLLQGRIQWYNPNTNSFIDVFDLDDTYSVWKPGTNEHITDVKQTSKGVFVVVNKTLPNVKNTYENMKTNTSFNYSSIECKTYLIYTTNTIKPIVSKIEINHTPVEEMLPLSSPAIAYVPSGEVRYFDSLYVYESDTGVIYLYGHAWYHDSTNKFHHLLQLVKTGADIESGVSYYEWNYSKSDDFGKELGNNKYGYDKIIDTNYGPLFKYAGKKIKFVNTGKFSSYGEELIGITYTYYDNGGFQETPFDGAIIFDGEIYNIDLTNTDLFGIYKYNLFTIEYDAIVAGDIGLSFADDGTSDFDIYNGIKINVINGVMFITIKGQTCIIGSWKLKMVDVTENTTKEKDEVLYDLKISFDNQDLYNNLPEDTSNSELDKFVIKEVGIINLQGSSIDKEYKTDTFRHITQFFMPHNFYNRASGYVDNVIMDDSDSSTGAPKEFESINNLKQLYKNICKGFKHNNLINSRFIKEGQTEISDLFVHKTNKILGDIEKYLKNTDTFKIELKVYPAECVADAKSSIEDNTLSFGEYESTKDVNITDVFNPMNL